MLSHRERLLAAVPSFLLTLCPLLVFVVSSVGLCVQITTLTLKPKEKTNICNILGNHSTENSNYLPIQKKSRTLVHKKYSDKRIQFSVEFRLYF